jgi:hypothetical protein
MPLEHVEGSKNARDAIASNGAKGPLIFFPTHKRNAGEKQRFYPVVNMFSAESTE